MPGSAPQWSPKGDRIAYLATPSSLISVVDADGTNAHTLVPANAGAPFSWSPDGAWIIGKSLGPSGALNVVNATTGAKVALTYLSPYYYPSWK